MQRFPSAAKARDSIGEPRKPTIHLKTRLDIDHTQPRAGHRAHHCANHTICAICTNRPRAHQRHRTRHVTPANTTAMVITLMIGSFVAILNQTLMISALPTLMHEFDVPSSTVQWLTTGFMLTNGIMIPITAFLIETFTTRQLFLYAMGIFAE